MGPGLTRNCFCFFGKSSQNISVLIFWSSIPCVFCLYIYVYTLLKVVGYYDLSVLSMSVMGFQKKSLDGGWVDGVSSIQFFLGIFGIFLTLQSPLACVQVLRTVQLAMITYNAFGYERPFLFM